MFRLLARNRFLSIFHCGILMSTIGTSINSLMARLQVYPFKSRKMSLYEFIAYVLVLLGGSTMIMMGKTMFGYIGMGFFSIGSILQIASKIKGIKERK